MLRKWGKSELAVGRTVSLPFFQAKESRAAICGNDLKHDCSLMSAVYSSTPWGFFWEGSGRDSRPPVLVERLRAVHKHTSSGRSWFGINSKTF